MSATAGRTSSCRRAPTTSSSPSRRIPGWPAWRRCLRGNSSRPCARRLAPGGIVCQWTHTYEITDADLRSLVATFLSVFPEGTGWLIGQSDLLLVASTQPLSSNFKNVERAWTSPGIAADLAGVSAVEPFAFWSLFAGGPQALKSYAAARSPERRSHGARVFRAAWRSTFKPPLRTRLGSWSIGIPWRSAGDSPRAGRRRCGAVAESGHDDVRRRGLPTAYRDYLKALELDPEDAVALGGLVQTAAGAQRTMEALDWLNASLQQHPRSSNIRVATSKLLAGSGAFDRAIAAATEASRLSPGDAAPVQELAASFSDLRDADRLADAVRRLFELQPDASATHYYAAVSKFLAGHLDEALALARKAASIDPSYVAAHTLIGNIYGTLGRQEDARTAFQVGPSARPAKKHSLCEPGTPGACFRQSHGRRQLLRRGLVARSRVGCGACGSRAGARRGRRGSTPESVPVVSRFQRQPPRSPRSSREIAVRLIHDVGPDSRREPEFSLACEQVVNTRGFAHWRQVLCACGGSLQPYEDSRRTTTTAVP